MKRKIYVVPHTHYDVVWAFNKEDYFFINSSILKKAAQMIKDGEFRFLIEQTYPLEMIEHLDPDLFADLEEAIRSGKIEIVDGQYIMADPMIPGGEVLIREILFGKRYAKEKFDVDIPVAWVADGFGLNAQLPQIYKKSGYKWLAFRRGLPKWIGSRVSEFLWEGLDGTKITAHWMPLGYRAGLWLDSWQESYEQLAGLATSDSILMPCGSGGAIPQDEIPERLEQWNREHQDSEMIMATPREFFENFNPRGGRFVTYKGELYSDELENIFPDVASSRMRLKLAIRNREHQLMSTEKAAALASLLGKSYPAEIMTEMWKKMLFLANHDVLPSCGIDEIYEEAWEYVEEIQRTLTGVKSKSLSHLMPGGNRGSALVVFNPNSWRVKNWVEAEVELGEGWAREPGIACNDKEIPSEAVEVETWDDGTVRSAKIGFVADVPALGCRSYRVVRRSKTFRSRVEVRGNEVGNKFFRIVVDPETGILDVYDRSGRRILAGNEVILDQEIGDLYFHRSQLDGRIGSESGEGIRFGVFKPEEFEIKKGPLRTVITCRDSFYCLRWPYYLTEKFKPRLLRHKTLEVCKRIIVHKDLPRIDFVTHLNLLQSHVRVRLKFDTCMAAPTYTRQTQFGVLELPFEKTLHGSLKVPSLTWINSQENGRGLAVMTEGMPINEIRGGEVFCTMLRSVSVLAADGKSGPLIPTPEAQELGHHKYFYSVYPFEGDWRECAIHRRAGERSQPLQAVQVDREPVQTEFRSFTLEPDNLIVSALKQTEDGTNLLMRFFETRGQPCRAILTLPPQVKGVVMVNLLEEGDEPLPWGDGRLEMDVGPFEIVSLKLELE
jgi:alpha-mannosidase